MKRLLVLGLLVLLAVTPSFADPSDRLVAGWQKRLTQASDALKAGDYKKAERQAAKLLSEMCDSLYGGEGVGNVLATTLALRALAQAGQGKTDDALWSWWGIQALDPSVTQSDLSPYGPAAEKLLQIVAADAAERPPSLEIPLGSGVPAENLTPPEVLSRQGPKFPRAVNQKCIEGTTVLESVIRPDGEVRWPKVLEAPPVPVMTLAVLESFRSWKFRPAEQDGQPVAVWYVVTIQFKTPHCIIGGH